MGAGGPAFGEVSLIEAASIAVRFRRWRGRRNWTFQAWNVKLAARIPAHD
jgi:hypothetical protein